MRIEKIKLRNLRSYQEAETPPLGNINFFGGLNAAGKTTLRDALSLLVSGTCAGCETGRDLGDLRTLGSKKRWAVHAKTKDGTLSRREGEGPRSNAQTDIERVTGTAGPTARACLFAGELLRLDKKARQRLVLDLVKPAGATVPDELQVAISEQLGIDLEEGRASLTEIEDAYRVAYERRRDVGRDLKQIGERSTPAAPEGMEQLRDLSTDDLRELLSKIRETCTEIQCDRDAAVQLASQVTKKPDRLAATIERLETEIKQAEERLGQAPAKDIGDQTKKLLAKKKELEEAQAEARTKLEKLTRQIGQRKGEVENLQNEVAAFKEMGPKCDRCGKSISAKQRETFLREKQNRYEAAVREGQKLTGDSKAIEENLENISMLLGENEREMARLEGVEEKYTGRKAALDRLVEQKKKAEADLETARKQAEEKGKDCEAKAEQLKQRAAEGERRLAIVSEYLGARSSYEQMIGEKKALVSAHAALDNLVTELGPEGPLRQQLAGGDTVEKFQGDVNAYLEPMGFQVDLGPMMALDGEPVVNGTPARMLSKSEQIRFSLAFAIAVAHHCGLGIVAVDDWEAADRYSAAAALQVLLECPHQVFVFTKITDTPEDYAQKVEAAKTAGVGIDFFYVWRKESSGSQIARARDLLDRAKAS